MRVLSAVTLVEIIQDESPFIVWNDMHKIDTRPRVAGGDYLPVEYSQVYINGDTPEAEYAEGDIMQAVIKIKVGATLIVPKYLERVRVGETHYTKTRHGFRIS